MIKKPLYHRTSASDRHAELRSQNRINLIGLYTFVGILVTTAAIAMLSLIF